MEKAKISASQLFILMVLFELGTSLLLPVAMEAKQDAWLAILLGMLGSLVLFVIYYKLYSYYPDLLPTEYMQKILGKAIGSVLAFLYISYFIYDVARVLRDIGEMLLTFSYSDTPLFIANALLILVIIYTVQKGIEVVARSGELFFIFMYVLAVTGFLLIVCSGLIDFKNLQPVLEDGILPVLKVVFIQTLYFPFGEAIVFTMILPYLNNPKKAKVTMLCATGLSGINLTITMLINISVLGVDLTARSQFPLLSTVQSIQVADFLERLDVFFMLALVIGGFSKISVLFYASMIATATLFKIKSPSRLSYPIGLIVLFMSLMISRNFQEHLHEGIGVEMFFLQIPFLAIIPVLLFLVAFFKNRKQQKA
ncbi:GerAB/ArcD/ProY family transporter [Priestia megaterium]|jgi:spore germination protein KB|uniref:GerAB/ArcD/ProY family transporter n=11 Tax=Priestia megaterium TaxID=1404 RepID=A0AAE5UAV6_PRIMG|nr:MULTISPECIES: GerAB/ArcD/ProY family transporter [Priestia]KOP69506.1 spore gernimation protein KB [Bacillus sp. FJAT-21351]KQU17924.1 spore gernimation protein KB [Bacillus sp. Leaf75]KRF51375.1 spore gernimation protein KB [Bacillus sp. Soil531]MCF6799427.1 spore germination protein [Bacillus sp. ET1]MCJ7983015.1 spore germination protein [Priestia sp. OVL9]MDP9579456.1 spore germination protein KB [Bacillus sp. 1751]RFB19850.1 spore gernimation protein KB [Bacillus sp. ALD]RFB32342.1 